MSQSTPPTLPQAGPMMTCLNPNAHHITVTSSQTWDWIVSSPRPRKLSPGARKRYTWLHWHATHGRNVSLTCRRHGITRTTFYRWQHRFEQCGLSGLKDRSHRPKRVRRPTWTPEQVQAVVALREAHPRWGKAKLAVLLAQQGHHLSVSMVGRILRSLRLSGQLREAQRSRRRRGCRAARPHAVRKPKEYTASRPGDLVQVDTLDVEVTPGARFKHLSVVDVVSRWTSAEARRSATARCVRDCLDHIRDRLPFPVKAVQVDGGSEFMAEFEAYCQLQDIKLFVLPPRSPKLNGKVERMQRTYREEFYEVTDAPARVDPLNEELLAYDTIFNTVRPHQALDYRTPQQYLDSLKEAA